MDHVCAAVRGPATPHGSAERAGCEVHEVAEGGVDGVRGRACGVQDGAGRAVHFGDVREASVGGLEDAGQVQRAALSGPHAQ